MTDKATQNIRDLSEKYRIVLRAAISTSDAERQNNRVCVCVMEALASRSSLVAAAHLSVQARRPTGGCLMMIFVSECLGGGEISYHKRPSAALIFHAGGNWAVISPLRTHFLSANRQRKYIFRPSLECARCDSAPPSTSLQGAESSLTRRPIASGSMNSSVKGIRPRGGKSDALVISRGLRGGRRRPQIKSLI